MEETECLAQWLNIFKALNSNLSVTYENKTQRGEFKPTRSRTGHSGQESYYDNNPIPGVSSSSDRHLQGRPVPEKWVERFFRMSGCFGLLEHHNKYPQTWAGELKQQKFIYNSSANWKSKKMILEGSYAYHYTTNTTQKMILSGLFSPEASLLSWDSRCLLSSCSLCPTYVQFFPLKRYELGAIFVAIILTHLLPYRIYSQTQFGKRWGSNTCIFRVHTSAPITR